VALRNGSGRQAASAPVGDPGAAGDGRDGPGDGTLTGAATLRLPLLLGALGAFAIAFSGIYVRLSTVAPPTSAVFRCLYAVPVLALLARRETHAVGTRDLTQRRRSLLAGVAFAVDLVAWHYAIDVVGAGLATVLANVQVVIVGLVAWVALGERPSRATMGAVPVMLFGVVLISGVIGADAYGEDPTLGAALGLLAAAAYSGYLLLLRAGNADQAHRAGALLDATLVGGLGAAVAGLALGDLDLVPSWPEHGWLVVLALNSQVVGWLLISYALPRLPAIVTSVLLLLQPVSAVLLGIVLLDEAPSTVQLGGVALVLVGIVVSTASDTAGRRDRRRSHHH